MFLCLPCVSGNLFSLVAPFLPSSENGVLWIGRASVMHFKCIRAKPLDKHLLFVGNAKWLMHANRIAFYHKVHLLCPVDTNAVNTNHRSGYAFPDACREIGAVALVGSIDESICVVWKQTFETRLMCTGSFRRPTICWCKTMRRPMWIVCFALLAFCWRSNTIQIRHLQCSHMKVFLRLLAFVMVLAMQIFSTCQILGKKKLCKFYYLFLYDNTITYQKSLIIMIIVACKIMNSVVVIKSNF